MEALFKCTAYARAWDVALVVVADVVKRASQTTIGLRIVKARNEATFMLTTHFERAAHVIPTFDDSNPSLFFVNDLVDYDMYLRFDSTHVNGA